MTRLLLSFDRLLCRVEVLMMILAGILIIAIMLLVASDALGRYLFRTPIAATYDLVTGYMLPSALLLALSFTLRQGGHVNLDFFIHLMPSRRRNFVVGALLLASTPIVVVMATGGAMKAWHSWQAAEVTIGVYSWPVWLREAIVPVSMGVLALRMAHVALLNLLAAFGDDDAIAIPISPERIEPAKETA
ncbi:TRAP transporter small permease subunit [Pseudogemmobacter sonorensis]|uniref:TRAP transporter small permease subunit n=1 Tax=Pseudogemmobacter sonorensis TaxID=2989681 RepID=UPI0036A428AD